MQYPSLWNPQYLQGVVKRVKAKWMNFAPQFWWGDRLDARFLVVPLLNGLKCKRVLDVGCNAGVMLSETPADNFRVGIDLSSTALGLARKVAPGAALCQADMLTLPFGNSSFDVVIFCGMLEVPNKQGKMIVLQEIWRVLRTGGTMYLSTLNRRHARYRKHSLKLTCQELEESLVPYFDYVIHGFNPLPKFLPNPLLARWPGIWRILLMMMKSNVARQRSCGFLARAVRKDA